MKRNALAFVILVGAIIGMLAAGKYLDRTRKYGPLRMVGDVKGVQAPDFDLPTLDGGRVKLSAFRGKAVLLNFWATWCPPCKIEMPWFVEMQKQYGKDGLVVLGVAMDDTAAPKIAEFAHEMGVNYQVLLGTDQVSDDYGNVQYLPTTFYVDRNGVIVDKAAGLFSRDEIENDIKKILASSYNSGTAQTSRASVGKTRAPVTKDTP
ncbi:MAG: TlpA family protein disulfide reductase [Terriglobales bacterium]